MKGGLIAPLRASASGMQMLDISPDASEMLALKLDLNDENGRGSIWSSRFWEALRGSWGVRSLKMRTGPPTGVRLSMPV